MPLIEITGDVSMPHAQDLGYGLLALAVVWMFHICFKHVQRMEEIKRWK